jgi:hypothetical protein
MKLVRISVLGLAAMLAATTAFAGNKGANLFAIELGNGTADLYFEGTQGTVGNNYISAFDHSEIIAQVQGWHMMTDEYGLTVTAGVGFFNETDKPRASAPAGTENFKYSQSSFNVRVGLDRFFSVGDQVMLYGGPGIEYWSGKSKFDYSANSVYPDFDSQNVGRTSLNGRIGTIIHINDTVGFGGHIGHSIGMASATDQGRKATWWPSHLEGAGGLIFSL